MKTIYLFSLLFAFWTVNLVTAQNLVQTQGGAVFNAATDTTPASAELTKAVTYSYGAVYLASAQNLNNPLTYEFDLLLGQSDGGADGIVFMLHNDARGQMAHGDVGMGLGYASSPNSQDHMNGSSSSVSKSVAIEFDTYRNSEKNDPTEDHIALVTNGNNNHSDFPNSYLKKVNNVEDNQFHRFKFVWSPSTNNVKVYLDNTLMLNVNMNIRTAIGGNQAYIGFSGTTGALVNTQIVRDVASPLPVELAQFSASLDESIEAVKLDWTTLSETNNSHFEIEKSSDGIRFEKAGMVAGNGNSNVVVSYSFYDYAYDGSTIFYRLKQVDFDGKYEYSPVLVVQESLSLNESKMISAIASGGSMNVNLLINQAGEYQVQVFDLSGKVVSETNASLEEGMAELNVVVSNYKQGSVFLVSVSDQTGWNVVRKTMMQ